MNFYSVSELHVSIHDLNWKELVGVATLKYLDQETFTEQDYITAFRQMVAELNHWPDHAVA